MTPLRTEKAERKNYDNWKKDKNVLAIQLDFMLYNDGEDASFLTDRMVCRRVSWGYLWALPTMASTVHGRAVRKTSRVGHQLGD